MAVELDDDQAMQLAGIIERAERDFSGQSLGAGSGQLAQLAANHVPLERYDASEPEQRSQWSMSVQPAPHVTHESHVSQPDRGPSLLDRKRAFMGHSNAFPSVTEVSTSDRAIMQSLSTSAIPLHLGLQVQARMLRRVMLSTGSRVHTRRSKARVIST